MSDFRKLNSYIGELDKLRGKSEEEVWGFFIEFVANKFKCEAASFFTVDEKRKILTFSKVIGPNSQDLMGISFSYTGIAGWCAEYKRDLFVKNTKDHPLFTNKVDYITKFKTKSVICIPCFYGNQMIVVEFMNPLNKEEFEEEDYEKIKLLCLFMSKKIYIQNLEATLSRLNEKAQGTIDNLSGGFIGIDLDGKIIFFNPKAKEILEVNANYIGLPYNELAKISPEIFTAIKEVLLENKIARRKEFFYNVGGNRKKIGYSTMHIKAVDGSITGAGIIFQDITE